MRSQILLLVVLGFFIAVESAVLNNDQAVNGRLSTLGLNNSNFEGDGRKSGDLN